MLVQSAESDNEITKGPLQKEPVLQWTLLAVGTGVKPKAPGHKQQSAWSPATVQAEEKRGFSHAQVGQAEQSICPTSPPFCPCNYASKRI